MEEYEEYDVLDYIDEHDDIFLPEISEEKKEIIEFFLKKRETKSTKSKDRPTGRRIKSIEYKLSTGKCGFANGHEGRVTFKSVIDRKIKVLKYETDAKKYYNMNNDNQDVDNLLIMASEFLGIPDFMADRAKFLLAKTWNGSGQRQNYNKMTYEMAALGILLYCCCDDLYGSDSLSHSVQRTRHRVQSTREDKPDFDMIKSMFGGYVKLLYPRLNPKTNLNQIKPKMRDLIRAYEKIKELCAVNKAKEDGASPIYEEREEHTLTASIRIKLVNNYHLRHTKILDRFEQVEIIRECHTFTKFESGHTVKQNLKMLEL